MRFLASEIADAVRGRLVGSDLDVIGASIDSRTTGPGELFVPLIAERDGHDFIAGALEAGAAAYLSAREPIGGTAIVVADTMAALTALAETARHRFSGALVAITGSVGKTSAKDMTAAALAPTRRTHASPGSFNNELGVPLTLLNAPEDTEAIVVEMGARAVGDVRKLCGLARPTVGVVTAVALAHTSEFGSIDRIKVAKRELVEALPAAGLAVLNADDPIVAGMAAASAAPVIRFGRAPDADVRAFDVEVGADLRASFTVGAGTDTARVVLPVAGEHHVSNALAAIAVATGLGAELRSAVEGVERTVMSPWRMELAHSPAGAIVINDAYNANPASVEAALRSLAAVDRRRIAVLGLMAELGDEHERAHREIGELAASLDIEVISVGELGYGGRLVADVDEAEAVLGQIGEADAVLIKGSRVAGLEELARRLVAAG